MSGNQRHQMDEGENYNEEVDNEEVDGYGA